MTKNYYKKNKEKIRKEARENKIFLKKKKKKSANILTSDLLTKKKEGSINIVVKDI